MLLPYTDKAGKFPSAITHFVTGKTYIFSC